MSFLKNILAAILGCLVAFGILLGMFLIVITLMGHIEVRRPIQKNTLLELSFTQPILDYTGRHETDPLANLWESEMGLDDILHAIKVAKTDARIQGISLTTGYVQAGMTQVREIREALLDFKSTGKFIYAYADFYPQKDYYLASAADKLYINPVGTLDFRGLATEVLYVKELQEKSGVKMEVIRHGKYKSAVEPYISNTMSTENRTQLEALLGALWNTVVDDIATTRNMAVEDLNIIADTLGGRTPAYAVASGLVDDDLHFDAYEALLKEEVGVTQSATLNTITLEDYIPVARKKRLHTGKDNIAVIYAQGEIAYGEGGKDFIGQDMITTALREAADREQVKAIVLRINSPGGSALVSDIIWREVVLAKAKKPVVVSLGNVAASGGYYIGVGGDKIVAAPTTITGSIGVFGAIPNVSQLAKNLGINAEQVGTHTHAVDYSFFEPADTAFRKVVEESIKNTYTTFLQRVAEGRDMTLDEVDALAQGRVWSGVDALENGLIDALGSLDDAIAEAATMANLKQYSIQKYPRYKSRFERWAEDLQGVKARIATTFIEEEIGKEAYQFLKELQHITQQKGIQTRMPFTVNVK